MAKRLILIAKELNVGTSTIVDFLLEEGFEVENKPTAKVSDEMYQKLTEEFSASIKVKAKADSLVIGTAKPSEPVKKPIQPEPIIPQKEIKPEVSLPKEEPEMVQRHIPEVKVKVIGKVSIDKEKKEEKPVQPEPEKEIVEQVAEKFIDKKPEIVEEETVKAEAPTLKGLKVLGKIDSDKLEKPSSKKSRPKPTERPSSGQSKDDHLKRKRKRKRKKVQLKGKSDSNSGRNKDKEEAPSVSQKEIEDKIKATMARIRGTSGKKRQKIRRDNRNEKRAKQDLIDQQQESEASVIKLTEFVTVSELASVLGIDVSEVITTCMNIGVIVSINQRLDAEIIELVAEEFGKTVDFVSVEDSLEVEEEEIDDEENLGPRAPIVTVMGHVDHGKTSLLDYIRNANVVQGEAGGITQHIGAYEVSVDKKGKRITFLDTPGHEAFTAMRARGAKVTDVVIVIIAADDRIMPQTKEAISHAQAAGVPIVFAINKIDKDGANPDKIKEQLAAMNLLVESWGGKYQSQDISAKTGIGINELLEKVVLEAELLELKANKDRKALGTVIEASLDKGSGYITKLLVQNGTLKIGDAIVSGAHSGKVKAMFNDKGSRIKSAGPSSPVMILGLNGAPQAGEKFRVVDSESEARNISVKRQQLDREQSNRANKRISLDEIGRRLALGSFKELNLIIKGDVDGSIEALSDSLIKLSIESVQVSVIHKAVGAIAESDVLLASASDAIIIGFQVRPTGSARALAEKEGVEIKTYSIIYEAIDEIKNAIEGLLDTIKEEEVVCELEVREIFKISRIGTIAGCYVNRGAIKRNTFVRLVRNGIVIYPNKEGVKGEIAALKRFKDDVSEVKAGFECGISLKNFNDIKQGDIIEGYVINEIKQTLD